MFEFHLHQILSQIKPIYLDDAAAFASLFPGVDSSLLESWRESIIDKGLDIRLTGSQGLPKEGNIVIVRPQGGQPDADFLGANVPPGFTGKKGAFEMVRAEVEILAMNPETCIALHTLCRAAVYAQIKTLLAVYDGVFYDGFAGPTPEEELILAEGLGRVARWQQWSARVLWKVPPLEAPPSLEWELRLADAGGGVRPYEE
jgi:hypothetical protein